MKYKQGTIISRSLNSLPVRIVTAIITTIDPDHIGIAIDNDFVIHYSGEGSGKSALIEKITLEEFESGNESAVYINPETEEDGIKITELALKICENKNNEFNLNYNFIIKNCEDFAKYVYENATGKKYPKISQVKKGLIYRGLMMVNPLIGLAVKGAEKTIDIIKDKIDENKK